eukprot:5059164-Prymnesium_polylepis.1
MSASVGSAAGLEMTSLGTAGSARGEDANAAAGEAARAACRSRALRRLSEKPPSSGTIDVPAGRGWGG